MKQEEEGEGKEERERCIVVYLLLKEEGVVHGCMTFVLFCFIFSIF